MILEQAVLDVIPGKQQAFEQAFQQAQKIISALPGYICHELHKCIETDNRYLLLVQWQTLEDHSIGFRQSSDYKKWKALLHYFYQPFPVVEHYQSLIPFRIKK
ncbi:antibiotic biosynthesis monooxygenase family protein [Paraglaciecola arctica]|uniref:Antibiotic biosynthesis monooxygenase n=1 Tax=Paraglaciecola arctica BSs20135 TaxID=493475 RepID=K6Y983_9ALTE|nr:antibiotic biosynthesis monooxygenase [Paraglaciecola arctica]GAC20521.1 antibiotic biosynthesis monooxygenase [Paraglaciecola arctica BSs20135]